MKTLGVAKAKAQFLALVDQVAEKREPVVLTRNGKAIAQVIPMPLQEEDPIFGFYRGKIEITGDIVSPLYSDDEVDDFLEQSAAQLT